MGALHILAKSKGVSSIGKLGVDIDTLQDWLVKRQMSFEGGFNGRSNKLVDGCYCFWVGSAISLIDLDYCPTDYDARFDSGVYDSRIDPFSVTRIREENDEGENEFFKQKEDGNLTFDQKLLQRYILLCAQDPNGGLRDKPSKGRDFYHSCYNLSGLSVSQHVLSHYCEEVRNSTNEEASSLHGSSQCLYQSEQKNLLGATHPVFNIRVERVQSIVNSFIKNNNVVT